MLNILLCDDDISSINKLTSIINKIEYPAFNIDSFPDATAVIRSKTKYDLCILDIDMPGVDGFELAEHLKSLNNDILIIFYSRLDHLVFESFKVHPFDFIRKSENDEQLLSKLQKAVSKACSDHQFYLWSKKSSIQRIPYKEIIYFYKSLNDLNICTINGEFSERKAIKDLSFPESFYKVSSSLVVNMNYIQSITENKIIFENGSYFTLSKIKARELKRHYVLFLSE